MLSRMKAERWERFVDPMARSGTTFFNNIKFWKIKPLWLKADVALKYTQCFFKGHNLRWGERYNYEPDYCDRCFVEWPQDQATLVDYLSRCYGFMVERDWRWFQRLDDWLWSKFRMPGWWSY